MEIKLSLIRSFVYYLINKNKILSSVIFYEILATLIYLHKDIDIRIPCIYTAVFETNCYACGLSEAVSELLKFNFIGASQSNFLVFPFLILVCYFLIKKYSSFIK